MCIRKEELMDNKGPFGIYDESFDLDRDDESDDY